MNNPYRLPDDPKSKVPAEEGLCLVCGASTACGWFARSHWKGDMLYLCTPFCALSFFASHDPPAHDHAARHEYYRIRKAVVKAAIAMTASPEGYNIQLGQAAL